VLDPLALLREQCEELLIQAIGKVYPNLEIPEIRFTQPPKIEMGELSAPISFQLARLARQRPPDIAESIADKIDPSEGDLISGVEALNGYINFRSDVSNYGRLVLESAIDLNQEYGFIKKEQEKVIVEHTSANPNGPIHVGNARNSILGDTLAKMEKKKGEQVMIHFLVNDMGRQVAMATYGWALLGRPEPQGQAELWVGTIYASLNVLLEMRRMNQELEEAKKRGWTGKVASCMESLGEYRIAAEELKERNDFIFNTLEEELDKVKDPLNEIVSLNTAYENKDETTVEMVRTLVGYCLKGFEDSLGELGITFDSFDYESDLVWEQKADEVLERLKKTPYVSVEEGALILDCDKIAEDLNLKTRWGLSTEHEIPRLVMIRRDGTTLYTLRDIAYSMQKFQKADKVINVIGYEQNLAQLQLRIALAALGEMEMADNQIHYAYEHVKLPGVKMSGRLGRYITLTEVLERAVDLAYQEVETRMSHLPDETKREIARDVGHGAVKYTLLSVDSMKTVVFDWEKALNFETNSAPFIQYSHARACNILKRLGERPEPEYKLLQDAKERLIISTLAEWPGVFTTAVDDLKPGNITTYANSLADSFNSFYASLHVLNAEPLGLKGARVALVEATRVVLRNSIEILGIKAPERM
jgi:arginyl-tRNA synthetase